VSESCVGGICIGDRDAEESDASSLEHMLHAALAVEDAGGEFDRNSIVSIFSDKTSITGWQAKVPGLENNASVPVRLHYSCWRTHIYDRADVSK
jgi:hypothetical protein